jgi:hypothetical protein
MVSASDRSSCHHQTKCLQRIQRTLPTAKWRTAGETYIQISTEKKVTDPDLVTKGLECRERRGFGVDCVT